MNTKKLIQMVEEVAKALKTLKHDFVFVGGAVSSLYVDDTGAQEMRPTDDVDCVVEIRTRLEYSKLESELRKNHFTNDVEPGSPICRFKYLGITVDVMPTNEKVLGFSNNWYEDGVKNAQRRILPHGTEVLIFSLPYYLASKFEAYEGRGGGDPRMSHDIEDIILVLNGCSNALDQIQNAPNKVKKYISAELLKFTSQTQYKEAMEGALFTEGPERVRRFISICKNASM